MALLLRDVVGLSYTEIADSLEITLATVKWRIYKGREEVRSRSPARASPSGRRRSPSRPKSSSAGSGSQHEQRLLLESGRDLVLRSLPRSPPGVSAATGRRLRRAGRRSAPAAAPRRSRRGPSALDAVRKTLRQRIGKPASRISACVARDVVGDAPERGVPARPGRGAARPRRGSPSRGWPTEPGLSSQRPACRSISVPPGAWPPIAPRPSTIASGTWLWPTSVIVGAGVGDRVPRRLPGEHVLPDRIARAPVVEADALVLERAERGRRGTSRASPSSTPRVHSRRGCRVAGEVAEVDASRARRGRGCPPGRLGALHRPRGSTRSAARRSRRGRRGTRPRRDASARSPRPPPRARGG